ncbi:MAG: tetratricopeptide repeat protein, partial [Alphaproteobacteria bacterium]|nr:tetratricopeptide repeat protein [Alphaproteobacteria bacterium]
VMRIHLQQGERALALKQFEACREILMRELGVEPDEETARLAEEARKQAPVSPPEIQRGNDPPPDASDRKSEEPTATDGRRRRAYAAAVGAGAMLALAVLLTLWRSDAPPPTTPEGISIAVLPFENFGAGSEQFYFSDGMTADLITDLSHVSGWSVIAYTTMREYKDRGLDEVAADLGVSHVITGRVRKVEGRIRINVALIDAANNHQKWGERYDRELTDVLKLQDEVVRKIVSALSVTLTTGERERLEFAEVVDPEAYDLLLRGLADYRRFTRATNIDARDNFERALEHDPDFARAQAALALTYGMEASLGWAEDTEAVLDKGLELAQRALGVDDNSREVHYALAVIYRNMGRHEEGIASARRSVEIDPNYADGYAQLAINLNYAGAPEEGLAFVRKAQSLNPRMPFFYVWLEGQSHYLLGQHEKALSLFQRVITSNPHFPLGHKMLVATYAELGQMDDAAWAAEELLTLEPDFTIEHERQATPYRDGRVLDAYLRNLHNAGLPIK